MSGAFLLAKALVKTNIRVGSMGTYWGAGQGAFPVAGLGAKLDTK